MNSKISRIRSIALVIIENEGTVLACPGNDPVRKIDFCRPVGGGIEFGETSLQAAVREVSEEIGGTLVHAKLLTVIENVFNYNGEVGHEIVFLYKGELADRDLYQQEILPILDKPGHTAQWLPSADIKSGKLKIFPEGIQDFIV